MPPKRARARWGKGEAEGSAFRNSEDMELSANMPVIGAAETFAYARSIPYQAKIVVFLSLIKDELSDA